ALLAILLGLTSNVVLVAFVWKLVRDEAIDELRRDTVEQSEGLAAIYRAGGLAALARTIDEGRATGDRSRIVTVIAADGRRVAGLGPAI
uniref:hypothetical protein n=2 Tax=Gammaproteobacteria TaxID=1236 RepID=UPI001BC9E09A